MVFQIIIKTINNLIHKTMHYEMDNLLSDAFKL